MKQSLKNSSYDPSFLKHISQFKEIVLSPDTPLDIDKVLKYQKGEPVLRTVFEGITEVSRAVAKTPNITASLFLTD